MAVVAGIDGCGPRWVAIVREVGSTALSAVVLTTADLAAQAWDLAAIDIPIGLPDKGARKADLLARKFIGPRASSVFPCPIRPSLAAASWQEACAITKAQDGRNISQQSYAILPKIREVDACVRAEGLQDRLFEIHPEVCFAALAGRHLEYPKRDLRGHQERRALIAAHFGVDAFEQVTQQLPKRGVAPDDIADAFAALWSAERIFAGVATRLPEEGQVDDVGLPMQIWY